MSVGTVVDDTEVLQVVVLMMSTDEETGSKGTKRPP